MKSVAPPKTCNLLQATQQSGAGGRAANRFTSDEAGGWAARGKQPRNRGGTGAEPRLQRAAPPVWPVLMPQQHEQSAHQMLSLGTGGSSPTGLVGRQPTARGQQTFKHHTLPSGSDSSVKRQLTHDMLLPGSSGSGSPFAWDVALAQRPSLQGVVPQLWAKPHAVAQQPSLLAAQQQLREDQALMDALAAEHHREQVQHAQQQQEYLAEMLARQHLLSQGSLAAGPVLAAQGAAESLGRLQRQASPSVAGGSAQDSPGARLRLRLQDLRQMQEQHQVTHQMGVHPATSRALHEGSHAACRQGHYTPTSCHFTR